MKKYLVTQDELDYSNHYLDLHSHPAVAVEELPPGAKVLTREEVEGAIEMETSALSPDSIKGILDALFGDAE